MSEFWKKGDGLGYRSCLDFSKEFEKESSKMLKDRKIIWLWLLVGLISKGIRLLTLLLLLGFLVLFWLFLSCKSMSSGEMKDEKDIWARTGCLPGLTHAYDEIIRDERKQHSKLLTSTMSYHERKLAGLCPLNVFDVTRDGIYQAP